ncbi:hypothetical protein [Actinophytocola gossypii]|uniref:DUF4352 domain-containing protein n=1 Tax=Actinophytocola gossypii TaxID=2812003 RepID=A0ABT2J6A1_9PSEU|nr:hypothetical protein [Actinophytocola gossypii]MCT2583393.1 hypothetical protein [Actinophytocola gossypii]
MGDRSRKLVAVVVAALAVTTACSEGSGSSSAAGGAGDGDNPKEIASADEVIEVVDQGFATYRVEKPGIKSDYLSYGFVVENVSDEVALTVRARVEFLDEAGEPVEDASQGHEFSVVLPGQRMGVGGSDMYADTTSDVRPTIADMTVEITLITALDTPDGERYRKPPGAYAELEVGDPVVGGADPATVEVTNTYDVPLKPKATAVVRDADGTIVGGMDSNATAQVQPGDSAQAEFFGLHVDEKRLAEGTIECYADPNLGRMITRTPVWHDV